jgi:polar amino acid transport system substrate-binding protein
LAALLVPAHACAIEILTEENPPFNFREGRTLRGISTEILQEMGLRAGISLPIRLTSWVRAYQQAMTSPNTCVYSTVRLPEREKLFKWIGPIGSNKWAFFARRDFDKPINTVEDARPYRIGGINQDANITYLQSLGFSHFDLVGDDYLNINKLSAGRIDLWITPYNKGKVLIKRSGKTDVQAILMVREVDYYLACNPNTSDVELQSLSRALQALTAEGFTKTVVSRYAEWFE